MAFFSSAHYRVHNVARLQHLASLNLPLSGRVLEVGSGPGDHTGFYLERGCPVVATDARQECIRKLKERYPQVEVQCVDMNRPEPLMDLGVFDIVHCYGLLYHLEEPERAIAAMSRVCGNLLLLETCVSPEPGRAINPASEIPGDYTQAVSGRACRPTRFWVFDTLKKYFPFVYQTRTQPNHLEFPTDWTAIPSDHGLIRAVFVASQRAYELSVLSPMILDHQEHPVVAAPLEVEIRDAALEEMRLELQRSHDRAALLEAAAQERLVLIEKLDAVARERLTVIERQRDAIEALRKQLHNK